MERPNRITLQEGPAAGALQRTAVSHIAFAVDDVAASEVFYTRVLGMHRHAELAGGAVRLGWGSGHHVLDLQPTDGGAVGIRHYGFEVRDAGGVDAIRERLTAAGVAFETLDDAYIDEAVGDADGIAVADPSGLTVHFHSQVHRNGENTSDPGRRPIKFQHTTLGTDDVEKYIRFYTDIIGFRISDQLADGQFTWLRSDRDHHTLAIVNVGKAGVLDHYSYDLSEWEDFKTWCDRLTELDVEVQWGPGRHGPGNNLFVFFDDPAGTHIELSAEMEKFWDDSVTYAPRRWQPVPHSVNMWGGQTPKWRKTSEQRGESVITA